MTMATPILPGLFLGNWQDAQRLTKVGLVVNCSKDIPFFAENSTVPYRIAVDDAPYDVQNLYNLIKDKEVFGMMDYCLKQGKPVLVHCFAGRQRSAAVMACFLMYKFNLDPNTAMQYIQRRRPIAFTPRANFYSAIQQFYTGLAK